MFDMIGGVGVGLGVEGLLERMEVGGGGRGGRCSCMLEIGRNDEDRT